MNNSLRKLVQKSNLIENKDFKVINLINQIRGGEGGPAKPKNLLCDIIQWNSFCPINNTGCDQTISM